MRPPPLDGDTPHVKLLSWNVTGLRALLKLESFSALQLAQRENFDVLCLQETKLQEKDVDAIRQTLSEGYDNSYWTCSVSKLGYSGTAIISRDLEQSKRVILTGDLNCAHQEIDIYNPAQYHRAVNRIRQTVLRHDFIDNQTEVQLLTHLKAVEKSASTHYSRSVFLQVRKEIQTESQYIPHSVNDEDGYKELLIFKYGEKTSTETKGVRSSDQCLSCTCGKFEFVWWPCCHMFCAMKALNMTVIPQVMLKERWEKGISFGILDNERNTATSMMPKKEMMFGSLHSQIYQLCILASESEDHYKTVKAEISSLISCLVVDKDKKVEEIAGKRRRLHVNCSNIIKDPEIVRTKGSQPETKDGKRKKRRCTKCRSTGHYKSKCTKGERIQEKTDKNNDTDEHGTSMDDDDIFY